MARPVKTRPKDELTTIPGIGPSLAEDLRDLGVRKVADLRRRDPERLYTELCALRGERQDPCVLYAFRCAAYFARTPGPAPELLKWWSWKDRPIRGDQESQHHSRRPAGRRRRTEVGGRGRPKSV